MRRALINVLPDEIRMRRRKGYMSRQPLKVLTSALRSQQGPGAFSACFNAGWFDAQRLSDSLNAAKRGEQVPLVLLSRTIALELWMQTIQRLTASVNARVSVATFPLAEKTASRTYKQDSGPNGLNERKHRRNQNEIQKPLLEVLPTAHPGHSGWRQTNPHRH